MRLFTLLIFMIVIVASPLAAQEGDCSVGQVRIDGVCAELTFDDLTPGEWHKIEPGGETACAHATPYAYWVRLSESADSNLLVYFQGGGGCWNADTCRDTMTEFNGFYDSRITERDHPRGQGGMLDFDNPDNPFSDYTTVYVPVCTGDVHWGDNTYTYEDAEDGDVTIQFKGFVNAAAALEWAYANVPQPESVFVTGCSAGSAGSIYHVPYIIERYPNVRVAQLGDSLSLLFTQPVNLQIDWHTNDNYPAWIPELANLEPLDWTMARQYIAVANHYPDYTFSQFNSVRDEVQVFYTWPDGSGSPDEWTALLDTHLQTIQDAAPNHRSFTPGGELHCITPRNAFYSYAINGVRFRDWVADMAAGVDVPTLRCEDCTRAEVIR